MSPASRTSRRFRRPLRLGGFTFIEILATMSLIAIVIPPVMEGISVSLAAGSYAKQQAQASMLAQSKMSELLAAGHLEHAALSGDFAPDNPQFRWSARLSDWEAGTLRQLDVTVSWTQRGQERSVLLSTLLYETGQS